MRPGAGCRRAILHTDEPRSSETAQQVGTRAVAEACDIFPEEFALLSDVPPAVYYEKADQAKPLVVSILAAVATSSPPPGSAEDADTIGRHVRLVPLRTGSMCCVVLTACAIWAICI